MKIEYDYMIVSDTNDRGWEMERRLAEGWLIKSNIATEASVHYVLSRELPAPAEDLALPDSKSTNTEDDDTPIDLSNIPF